jgi:lipid-binding SYLF domain-containing protein
MRRFWSTLLVALTMLAVLPACTTTPVLDQQKTVNASLATVERMKTQEWASVRANFDNARGVLIVPDLYKGGFVVGAQYGNAVLLARRADRSLGYPGFYTLAGGSLGFQIGAEDISMVLLIMSDKALNAVMTNQFTFGASGDLTLAVVGGGAGINTSTAPGVDIIEYAFGSVGLYGGVSMKGAVLTPDNDGNKAYYGKPISAHDVVTTNIVSNPQADRLREFLAH